MLEEIKTLGNKDHMELQHYIYQLTQQVNLKHDSDLLVICLCITMLLVKVTITQTV